MKNQHGPHTEVGEGGRVKSPTKHETWVGDLQVQAVFLFFYFLVFIQLSSLFVRFEHQSVRFSLKWRLLWALKNNIHFQRVNPPLDILTAYSKLFPGVYSARGKLMLNVAFLGWLLLPEFLTKWQYMRRGSAAVHVNSSDSMVCGTKRVNCESFSSSK